MDSLPGQWTKINDIYLERAWNYDPFGLVVTIRREPSPGVYDWPAGWKCRARWTEDDELIQEATSYGQSARLALAGQYQQTEASCPKDDEPYLQTLFDHLASLRQEAGPDFTADQVVAKIGSNTLLLQNGACRPIDIDLTDVPSTRSINEDDPRMVAAKKAQWQALEQTVVAVQGDSLVFEDGQTHSGYPDHYLQNLFARTCGTIPSMNEAGDVKIGGRWVAPEDMEIYASRVQVDGETIDVHPDMAHRLNKLKEHDRDC